MIYEFLRPIAISLLLLAGFNTMVHSCSRAVDPTAEYIAP